MGEVMTQAIIGMPYDMAMSDELSRRQFHDRAQYLLGEYENLQAENAKLRAELERRESHWFSLVMNCAAELEIASYCMTDTAAKRVAQSGADHYRKQANAAPSAPKCPTCRDVGVIGHSQICPECADTWKPAPKADDPVKQMLLEALNGMLLHIREPESESEFQWPEHFKKQKAAFAAARAAIAAARKGEGE